MIEIDNFKFKNNITKIDVTFDNGSVANFKLNTEVPFDYDRFKGMFLMGLHKLADDGILEMEE